MYGKYWINRNWCDALLLLFQVDTLQELLMREGVEPETVVSGDTDQQLFAVLKVSSQKVSLLFHEADSLECLRHLDAVTAPGDNKTREHNGTCCQQACRKVRQRSQQPVCCPLYIAPLAATFASGIE